MGSLSVAGEQGNGGGESPAPEPQEDAVDAQDDEDPAEGGLTPGSRRDRHVEERVNQRFGEFEKQWGDKLTAAEQRAQQVAQQNEYLRGQLEQLARSQQQPRAEARPDPAELRRQARQRLDSKDAEGFGDYERLTAQAQTLEAEAIFEKRMKDWQAEQQRNAPPQVHPFIAEQRLVHEHVRDAGQRGLRVYGRFVEDLQDAGWQPGEALVREAMRLANEQLGGQKKAAPKPAAYDRASAQALAGVPPGRAAATDDGKGGGDDEPKLSADEAEIAKNARMTPRQYAAWKKDPKAAAAAERKAAAKKR